MFQGTPLATDVARQFAEKRPEALRSVLTREMFRDLAPTPAPGTVLVPEVVFWLMSCVALGAKTMAAAMTEYWASVSGHLAAAVPLRPLTAAAFCTARKRLSLEFFSNLFSQVVARFDHHFAGQYRWKGLKLVSIDGTLLKLPAGAKELLKGFSPGSNKLGKGKHPQALLLGVVDVWNGLCRGFELVSPKLGEIAAAPRLIPSMGPDQLLLGDRNFACFELMARVLKQAANFVLRLRRGRFVDRRYKRTKLGPNEWLTTLRPSRRCRRRWADPPAEITVRIIRYQLPGFRPSWLITSLLEPERYPWQELVMLYHERWRQETAHRDWKYTLALSDLRSMTEEQIRKEVCVQLTLNNAVRWLMAEAAGTRARPVDLSFVAAKRLVLAASARMAAAGPSDSAKIYSRLLREIASCPILVRRGRHYRRRKNEHRARNKGHGRMALPARVARQPRDRANPGFIDMDTLPLMTPDVPCMTI